MSVRVSVALATLQGSRFVREQVRSILEQTVRVDELVVGDDGSSDDTLDLIRSELDAHADPPDLVLLTEPAGGVAANFSRVLAATSGDVVLLSDQDDRWFPTRVERALALAAERPDVDLVFGDARLIDADGADLGRTLFETLPVRPDELAAIDDGDALRALVKRNLVTGATVALRRAALDRALPVPPGWIHDEWLAITTAAVSGIAVLRDPLVEYRQHEGNEIGVEAPGLRRRLRRMTERRGDRNRRLAIAWTAFAEWSATYASPEVAALAAAKADFERRRARMPAVRAGRIPAILALASAYPRFASQGRLDILRDLLQPA